MPPRRRGLFEPFFTTKEKGKGTGLGLSIVYGIVKQNGGDILIYSEPGQGTTFKIYLPVVMAAAESLVPDDGGLNAIPATEVILLVEDDLQVRSLTRTMLARLGYRVMVAASAEEALRFATAHEGPLDLVADRCRDAAHEWYRPRRPSANRASRHSGVVHVRLYGQRRDRPWSSGGRHAVHPEAFHVRRAQPESSRSIGWVSSSARPPKRASCADSRRAATRGRACGRKSA